MKKVKIIVFFAFAFFIILNCKFTVKAGEFEISRTNSNYVRQGRDMIQIQSMPQYIFGATASNVYRYNIENDTTNEKIYDGYSRFYGKYIGHYIDKDIIYMATDTNNGETNITGFDVVKNVVVYDQNFPVQLESYKQDQFVVGSDGYAYFRNAEKSLQIYNNQGELTDEYSNISKDIYPVKISENNNILMFKSGYTAVKDGKFVEYNYKISSNIGDADQIYSRDGKYGLTKYGEIIKYEYEENKIKGEFYFASLKGYYKTGHPTGYFMNDGRVFLEGETNNILIYNLEDKKVEQTIQIDDDALSITFVTVYDNKIKVFGNTTKDNIGLCTYEYDLSNPSENEPTIIKNHVAYSHTKQEIINKYNQTKNTFNEDSVYEIEPSLTSPYSEGKLKDSYIQNSLKRINYYRWLAGLGDLSLDGEEWMQREQKGAVLSAVNNELNHYQTCPEDMDYDFYTEGNRACQSSIINQGSSLYGSISSFMNDHRNPMGNIGHRFELLKINGDKISMGYCNNKRAYATMHISENDEKAKENSEMFYSWPVPGYQEATSWAKDAKWSVFVQSNYVINKDEIKVTLTVDGKEYNPYPYVSVFNFIFYQIPDEVKSYLSDDSTSFISGRKANVKIEGIYDRNYNKYVIDYDTEFFYVNESTIEEISVYKMTSLDSTILSGVDDDDTITLNDRYPETYIVFKTSGSSATDTRLEFENENPEILEIENVTEQSQLKSSGYVYKLTGLKNGKTNVIAKRKKDGKVLWTLPVEISFDMIGDVNNDKKVNVLDCTLILKHIKGTRTLTDDERKRADLNEDGKINILDCTTLLKIIKKQ